MVINGIVTSGLCFLKSMEINTSTGMAYGQPYPAPQVYPSAVPPPPGSPAGYQGYLYEGYPQPPPAPLPAYQHYRYQSEDDSSCPLFIRGCLAAVCCRCVMEECCSFCF